MSGKTAWVENRSPVGWFPRVSPRELWAFRDLALVLAGRELKVRYKQTTLGLAWVVIQPAVATLIFVFIFGRVVGLSSEGSLPYAVYVFSGTVLWTMFATTMTVVSQSLVQNRELVTRTYFPALAVPLGLTLPGLVDLGVSLVALGVLMAIYSVAPTFAVVLLPLWVCGALLTAVAVGLPLAALNVRYRDVRHTMGFLVQVWFFATPVVYAASLVDGAWRYAYALNPMSTALAGFRWSAVGGPAPGLEAVVSLVVVVVVLAAGLVYFLRAERRFADVI